MKWGVFESVDDAIGRVLHVAPCDEEGCLHKAYSLDVHSPTVEYVTQEPDGCPVVVHMVMQ